jgi:predicted RNA-binding protein (virulence factor B family)
MNLKLKPELGRPNRLRVLKDSPHGLFLDGGEWGEILLPKRYVEPSMEAGGEVEVFLYRDSEDRLVATTEQPYAWAGEFGFFEVLGVTPGVGAFLDWGLSKDLLLPLREQARRVERGDWVVAAVMVDPLSERIVASTRLNRHMHKTAPDYLPGQRVRVLLAERTPLGFKAIIENAHWGLLYESESSGSWEIGESVEASIRRVRPDGKVDLGLDPAGYERVEPLAEKILRALEVSGGRISLDDRSSPEQVRNQFACSKKAFKQALGRLLKEGRIRWIEGGFERCEAGSERKAAGAQKKPGPSRSRFQNPGRQ